MSSQILDRLEKVESMGRRKNDLIESISIKQEILLWIYIIGGIILLATFVIKLFFS